METEQIIAQLLQNPHMLVDERWVLYMLDRHPSFIIPGLLMIKRNSPQIDPSTLQRIQDAAVLNCADRTALSDYIDPTSSGWSTFYPHAPEAYQTTTEETIDDFLETFGQTSTPEEDAVLERLILNPVASDYFEGTDVPYDPEDPLTLPPELMKNDDNPRRYAPQTQQPQTPSYTDSRIDRADEDYDYEEPAKTAEAAGAVADESPFMESLAKIFIKQRRYERAFEIISKLSLNYPEKSVYFADQLRFLQKLLINQQHESR